MYGGWQSISRVTFMNAKKRYNILVILTAVSLAFQPEPGLDYQKEFAGYYESAVQLAGRIRPLLYKYAKEFDEDPQLLEAIIFPELIRYNRFYDVIESGSLCVLYTRFGSDYADFSIGFFQMKPTFAQSLENYLYQSYEWEWVGKLKLEGFGPVDNFNQRMERVKRLQDLEWQIRYLIAFVKCCRLKHGIKNSPKMDELSFLATAYNSGWDAPDSEIRNKIHLKYFHLGRFDPMKKFAYADISRHWFLQLLRIKNAPD
jgi:hypothetical protein